MKISVIIPTYWGRSTPEVWKEGDAVYAHPIPLNSNASNLVKAIQSFNKIDSNEFNLIVIAAATNEEIQSSVEEKITEILSSIQVNFPLYLFTHSHLKQILESCKDNISDDCLTYLKLRGYSNIRNVGLFLGQILESDVIIFIDDDEYVDDPNFMKKATEYIGKEYRGKFVYGVSGYYRYNKDYHLKRPIMPWMTYWNKIDLMNKTFEKIIEPEPRLKITPYVFGGIMALHKNLYSKLPFDPNMNRGEEFDYLVDSLMFGYPFFLDNQWYIRHDPPPASYPDWMQIREDIYTFVYLRTKMQTQEDRPNMHRVYAEDFDPFPGYFLQKSLPEFIYKTNMILSNSYMLEGDNYGAEECLRNIFLAQHDALPKFNPFQSYLEHQMNWEKLMQKAAAFRDNLKEWITKI